jgi:hypothetical protein
MESSVLRFLQLVLCDLHSLTADGVPTRVDLDLARVRLKDRDVVAFFEEHPEILPPEACRVAAPGFQARQDWARLVNHKPYFTYKRDTGGIYKNDALLGTAAQRGEWELELEPCVHNVFGVLEHVLNVDFRACRPPAPNRSQQRAVVWAAAGEAHTADVSSTARWHFDFALRCLSRPGLELRGHVHPPRSSPRRSSTVASWCDESALANVFYVDLDVAVNGSPAWRWVLTRTRLQPCTRYAHLCAVDDDGRRTLFITSKHSHIEDHSRKRGSGWREDVSWAWLRPDEGTSPDERTSRSSQAGGESVGAGTPRGYLARGRARGLHRPPADAASHGSRSKRLSETKRSEG